ncbi:MAG: hypothetical protein JSR33_02995 [Proteobacteria bacterium]|nr:hypothetical protein [Pseudomonadota bacterium]
MKGSQIFNNFKGVWKFERFISNEGSVKGQATFAEIKPNVLKYSETGVWIMADKNMEISRQYQYHYNPETDKIIVFFDENPPRLFYELNVAFAEAKTSVCTIATGEHLCNKDTYKATYKFISSNQFTLFYQVNGPRKQYVIQTNFELDLDCH